MPGALYHGADPPLPMSWPEADPKAMGNGLFNGPPPTPSCIFKLQRCRLGEIITHLVPLIYFHSVDSTFDQSRSKKAIRKFEHTHCTYPVQLTASNNVTTSLLAMTKSLEPQLCRRARRWTEARPNTSYIDFSCASEVPLLSVVNWHSAIERQT